MRRPGLLRGGERGGLKRSRKFEAAAVRDWRGNRPGHGEGSPGNTGPLSPIMRMGQKHITGAPHTHLWFCLLYGFVCFEVFCFCFSASMILREEAACVGKETHLSRTGQSKCGSRLCPFFLGLPPSFPLSSVPPPRQSCQCLPPAWPPAGSLISISGLGSM